MECKFYILLDKNCKYPVPTWAVDKNLTAPLKILFFSKMGFDFFQHNENLLNSFWHGKTSQVGSVQSFLSTNSMNLNLYIGYRFTMLLVKDILM